VAVLVAAGLLLVHQVDHVLRRRRWVRVALAAALLVTVQPPHMFWETPADQYGTWARGVSWLPAALGRPNLLGVASPVLGWASAMKGGAVCDSDRTP
jgi:hypothetical protein